MFLVGFCCLFAVQTPAAFEELSDFPLAVILPRSVCEAGESSGDQQELLRARLLVYVERRLE